MFNKEIATVCKKYGKKAKIDRFKFINYRKDRSEFFWTDGHILFVEKTDAVFDADKSVSATSGEVFDSVAGADCVSYDRVLETTGGDTITAENWEVVVCEIDNKKIKVITFKIGDEETFIKLDFIEHSLEFVGNNPLIRQESNISPIRFDSEDGKRTAIAMPVRGLKVLERLGKFEKGKSKKEVITPVYVVIDTESENFDIVGVFKEKTDASRCVYELESENYRQGLKIVEKIMK
jgi:hypothetical protein